jgi:pSer/pThr/pTyr-binding forkhead associated (FHA) protein
MSYIRVYLGDRLQEQIELTQEQLTIGRARDNDLVLKDPGISAHHAVILREGNRFIIEDRESTNGVYLNNKRVDRAELKYWDEIQIYNHVLKFMALSGLKDNGDPDVPAQSATASSKTVMMDLSVEKQLAELRSRKKRAFVTISYPDGSETRFPFDKVELVIGRSSDCDMTTGGWLAPRRAATLEKSSDGYYLIPHWRGQVRRNGEPVKSRTKLRDGDELRVRKLNLRFLHRVSEE